VLLRKEFTFDAAHNLVRYHGKCEALHGHTYRIAVVLEGIPDEEGMIMDFTDLSGIVKERVVSRLDHSYINDIIEQPTAENIAYWIWDRIETDVRRSNCALSSIEVWETNASCVTLKAEDKKRKCETCRKKGTPETLR
jgi:6-pyruvoyltetrahydropterin/6-carboxytetrahydropterin synthase